MTEQQMPARIYIRTPLFGGLEFVRADLAERMAEALSDTATLLKSFSTPDDATAKYILDQADSALSAFRTSTQDIEARHD